MMNAFKFEEGKKYRVLKTSNNYLFPIGYEVTCVDNKFESTMHPGDTIGLSIRAKTNNYYYSVMCDNFYRYIFEEVIIKIGLEKEIEDLFTMGYRN